MAADVTKVKGVLEVAPTKASVTADIDAYLTMHAASPDDRRSRYVELVNDYYDLATDFYEYGWGASFHFAPRRKGEGLRESIRRYEHEMAQRLHLTADSHVLDVGCGIGGPMRAMAAFTGCRVTGINNNAYQIRRAIDLNAKAGQSARCLARPGDFMRMPFESDAFDAAYAIEATVHAPDLAEVYREIYRVLKPGSLFLTCEWCMTSVFNPEDAEHQAIKRAIEIGNGIPSMGTAEDVLNVMALAGFERVDAVDEMAHCEVPWWEPLRPSKPLLSPLDWRRSLALAKATRGVVRALEWVHLLPRGAASVGRMLAAGGEALVAGGKAGIFTPGFVVVARKPA
jgi:sterol 24-C-methyltransferase